MANLEQMSVEEKRNYFGDKYLGQARFIGKSHDSVKLARDLMKNKSKAPNDMFIIPGIWAHEKAMDYKLHIKTFIFCPDVVFSEEAEETIDDFINMAEESYIISEKVLNKISNKNNPDGIIAICQLPDYSLQDIELGENTLVVVLDGIEYAGNMGTILRSIDGVGADGVIICNRRAKVTHPKVIKGSRLSFNIPIVECETEEAIDWLKANEFDIFLADTRADKEYYEEEYRGNAAIVAGNERYGISEEWYQHQCKLISIPMNGDNDSLNVAIATTIILYEAGLKQQGKIKR